jgi:hypothetical protein
MWWGMLQDWVKALAEPPPDHPEWPARLVANVQKENFFILK